MPKIKYTETNLRKSSRDIIDQANDIIAEYQQQGLDLTLRQLYYQFVSRDVIANNEREYKRLGNVIAEGRLAGLIDWDVIVDRTRHLRAEPHWKDGPNILDGCAEQFRLDRWARQPNYVECWIEKDALVGVIEGVCEQFDVPYMACRGYASASEIWRAGNRRLLPRLKARKQCTVLYLGDHDPSGLDMTRDVQDRLDLFTGKKGAVTVKRLALNFDQVQEHQPPPNPTKMTDSRATNSQGTGYYDIYGDECWELDALDPLTIRTLIQTEVEAIIDQSIWLDAIEEEERIKTALGAISANWDDVLESLS